MNKVRIGIIGLGNMGASHCKMIREAADSSFELTAVGDIVREKAKSVGEANQVPFFTTAPAMYKSGLVDAVLIATPHYWHAPLTIQAARAGLHVLCEKPLASTVGPARAMIAECRKRNVVLGAMLMQRTRGSMMKMKQMVDAGEVGEVFRVSMICSSWYRTQAYYTSGARRGTWDGEGGGILLNQAPHSLDLFQWIGGMPKRVTAIVGTRLHQIEVENTANAIFEYGGGKMGYLYATTAEAPGMEQLMISGDKGTLVCEGDKVRIAKLVQPISEHLMTCPTGFDSPKADWQDVTWDIEPKGLHINVTRAFAAHVLDRSKPMIASGDEAVNELELSNAVYLAGFRNKPTDLPVDAEQIDRLIASLERQRSTGKGGGLRTKAARVMRKLLAEG